MVPTKQKPSWKKAALDVKREMCKPPEGAAKLEDIAEEMDMSVERARIVVQKLVREGRAEQVRGKTLNPTGVIYNTTYYRLLDSELPATAAKSRKK